MKKSVFPLRFVPFAIWFILIFILLILPGKDFAGIQNITDSFMPNFDKIVHIGLFGGLVFWFGLALIHVNKEKTKRITVIIAVISCLYGVGMEYVQKYFTNHTREFSYGDMAADAVGAIIGYFFTRWITAKYQSYRKKNNRPLQN